MTLLNGICACDRCGKDVKKGEAALNIRKSKLYCKVCWEKMKSYDPNGEELPLNVSWEQAIEKTKLVWVDEMKSQDIEKAKNVSNESSQKVINEQADPATLTNQGFNFYKQDKLDNAIEKYREALKIDPNFSLARSNLAFIYKKQDKLEEAIEQWEEVLQRGAQARISAPIPKWIAESRALLNERKKNIENIDTEAIDSYIHSLGEANSGWLIARDTLARIGEPVVPLLIKALKSNNSLLCRRSADLLGEIGNIKAIEPLIKSAESGNQDLSRIATDSLKKLKEKIKNEGGEIVEKKWWQFWK